MDTDISLPCLWQTLNIPVKSITYNYPSYLDKLPYDIIGSSCSFPMPSPEGWREDYDEDSYSGH
ncbi:hypothetical protein GCM10011499_22290 [Pelagibacterium lentulum]|uniref:Uncharacterized protein n=1 Tax=Pelagibacterium lentulum TaxID=2029865 RepID=A0A916RFI1_9HYPH|nr:hypothetical protein GCM10011499_22290 [Pelagibacterium lentulum]